MASICCGDDIDGSSRREKRVLPAGDRCHVPLSSKSIAVSAARERRCQWFTETTPASCVEDLSPAISLLCAVFKSEDGAYYVTNYRYAMLYGIFGRCLLKIGKH